MKANMIEYSAADSDRPAAVMVAQITHLTKESEGSGDDYNPDPDVTLIHLVNGTALRSDDSIRTLFARINSATE